MGKLSKLIGDEVKQILDMSDAARMQRAKDMGFDTENTYYHGTRAKIDQFNIDSPVAHGRQYGKGVYVTKNKKVAGRYSSGNEPLNLLTSAKLFDSESEDVVGSDASKAISKYLNENSNEVVKNHILSKIKSYKGGFKGSDIDFEGLTKKEIFSSIDGISPLHMTNAIKELGYDGISLPDQSVIFDPKNIRRVDAAFDPAKKDSGNLLAGALPVGAIGAASMLSPNESYAQTVNKQAMPRPDDIGSIKAPVHPRAAQMAEYFDRYNRAIENTPIGMVLPEAPTDWANKLAYDGKTRIKDRIIAALGLL